jgi:hypothetical protein
MVVVGVNNNNNNNNKKNKYRMTYKLQSWIRNDSFDHGIDQWELWVPPSHRDNRARMPNLASLTVDANAKC